jgi:hypothetical protein
MGIGGAIRATPGLQLLGLLHQVTIYLRSASCRSGCGPPNGTCPGHGLPEQPSPGSRSQDPTACCDRKLRPDRLTSLPGAVGHRSASLGRHTRRRTAFLLPRAQGHTCTRTRDTDEPDYFPRDSLVESMTRTENGRAQSSWLLMFSQRARIIMRGVGKSVKKIKVLRGREFPVSGGAAGSRPARPPCSG